MPVKSRIKESEEVDITPMIDIVFQLIIFFMVVMAIAVVYGVAIKFPAGGPPRDRKGPKPKNIIVDVQADWIDKGHYIRQVGMLKVNGEEIPLARSDNRELWPEHQKQGYDALEIKMKELVEEGFNDSLLIIRGDMKTYHDKVMKVIDRGKRLDIDGFSLVPPTK
jgi:biopolymer transport protein ExbD